MKEIGARLGALDGLRGLAAVVVVIHHALLTVPQLAGPYFGVEPTSAWAVYLVNGPGHLVWAGTEAVYLFFVLSGYVLVRAMSEGTVTWENYYVSRVVRLLVPVAAASVLAWLLFAAVDRSGQPSSLWLALSAREYGPASFLADATLVGGESGAITPLWSLRWEVIFSLALPLAVVAARRARSWTLLAGAVVVSCVGAHYGNGAATYLPAFVIGAALWAERERLGHLRSWWDGLPLRSSVPLGLGVLIVALAFGIAYWWVPEMRSVHALTLVAQALRLIGVGLLVVLAIVWRPLAAVLTLRPMRWLGAVSFSLYLVHEPIIKTVAFAFPDSRVAIGASVVVSGVVAWLFYRGCELPVHRWARRLKAAPLRPPA